MQSAIAAYSVPLGYRYQNWWEKQSESTPNVSVLAMPPSSRLLSINLGSALHFYCIAVFCILIIFFVLSVKPEPKNLFAAYVIVFCCLVLLSCLFFVVFWLHFWLHDLSRWLQSCRFFPSISSPFALYLVRERFFSSTLYCFVAKTK